MIEYKKMGYNFMIRFFKYSLLAFAGLGIFGVSACSTGEPLRSQVAMRIASPAWMVKRPLDAGPFVLTAFERMHENFKPATIYIEGNGEAQLSIGDQLFDATPRNPVGLHLAAMDKSENVAYLARPCQYSELRDQDADCGRRYWGDAQYSPEIMSAYQSALDGIKARYDINSFDIVGYGGGATIAAFLAGQRADVTSLRTVAGTLDLEVLEGRFEKLASVPQHHFIGGQDTTTTPADIHSYLQALGSTQCADYTLIQEAAHEKGWVNKWPELLGQGIPECRVPPKPEFVPIEKPEPIYVPRMSGSKK